MATLKELKAACDEEDHWELYERIIGRELRPHQMIISPLRNEKHPSFGLYRAKGGKALWKDFAGDTGDIYAFVALWNNIGYRESVEAVAGMLGIHHSSVSVARKPRLYQARLISVTPPAQCSFIQREWDQFDRVFWAKWGISTTLLDIMRVAACERFLMVTGEGKEIVRDHRPEQPLYVYCIGEHHKLYDPKAPDRKYKYLGNTRREDVFAMDYWAAQEKREKLVLCAGQKDALTCMANLRLPAISMNSESTLPDNVQMLRIANLANQVYVLYDNDKAVKKYSEALVAQYPFVERVPFESFARSKDLSEAIEAKDGTTLAALREFINRTPIGMDVPIF